MCTPAPTGPVPGQGSGAGSRPARRRGGGRGVVTGTPRRPRRPRDAQTAWPLGSDGASRRLVTVGRGGRRHLWGRGTGCDASVRAGRPTYRSVPGIGCTAPAPEGFMPPNPRNGARRHLRNVPGTAPPPKYPHAPPKRPRHRSVHDTGQAGPGGPSRRSPGSAPAAPLISSTLRSRRRRCACLGAGPGSARAAGPTGPGRPTRP